MAMQLKTSLKLSQQLRMTPQLQQAIKLLQLSRLELETAVRKELDENPGLEEIQDSDEEIKKTETKEEVAEPSPDQTPAEAAADADPRSNEEFEWESYLDSNYRPPSTGGTGNEEIMNYENLISTTTSLHDHLTWQLSLGGFNEEEENLVAVLISYVDDDGYIKTPLEEIAREESVNAKELEDMILFLH